MDTPKDSISSEASINSIAAKGIIDEASGKNDFQEQLDAVKEGLKSGFHFDGCTGVPDFNFGSDCCGEHDYNYQRLGITRAEADKKLRWCIQRKASLAQHLRYKIGLYGLSWVYWAGVRIFGSQYFKKVQNEKIANTISADSGGPLGSERL